MTAVRIIIGLIPIVGIITAGNLLFFYFLWRHKQIIRQIETNIYVPPKKINIYLFCLLLGLLLTVTGGVLSVLFFFIAGVGYVLLGGLIPFSVGISLLLFYATTRQMWFSVLQLHEESVK